MTRYRAAEVLELAAIGDEPGPLRDREIRRIYDDPEHARTVLRHARAAVHPDRNDGDQSTWDLVERAARVLGVLS